MTIRALLLCAVLVGCAQAPPAVDLAEEISSDAGQANAASPRDDPARWAASPAVLEAIGAARKHWAAQAPDYPEDVRVLSTTTGAFTRAGAEQRAVLFRMSLYPRGFPKKGLAILEGDRLVRNVAFVLLAENVRALPDFDGDGRDEIAFEGGFGMGGQDVRGVTLAAFGDEGLTELGSVEVYESVCAMAMEDSPGPTSARLSVAPGAGLMIERFRKASCEAKTWESLGPPEPLVLDPPQESPFEELAVSAQ